MARDAESRSDTDASAAGAAHAATWFIQNSLDASVGIHDGALAWVNHTWTRLTGWSAAESIGRPFWDFLHPDEVDAARSDLPEGKLGERRVFERRIATKSGGWLTMQHHAVGGAQGWVLMILRDVTEERLRERDSEEARRISAMVRNAAGVVPWRYNAQTDDYEIDPDFTTHAGSDRRRPAEVVRGAMHPDDRPLVVEALDRSVLTGEPGEMEYRSRGSRDTDWRRMRVTWQGVRPHPDGRWDVLGIAEDITRLTEARDAAQRGEKAALAAAETKGQFLANISHEIRTPMNGVLGVLHLIKSDPPTAERQRLIDQALAAGGGLSDLLNDIIDYADVEAGRLELLPEPLDPVDQLAGVMAGFANAADAKGVTLRTEIEPGIGWVIADAARLRKMAFHLIGNAVKFTPRGAVQARLGAAGAGEARRLRIEIQDTGIGVAHEARAGLFERFNQADSSTTRRYGGPGLGLAITRRLAELMGGSVGYAPRPGGGSIFWAEVSAPQAAAPGQALETDDDAWLAGIRVLVVEDNPTNRIVATQMLGQLGAEVSTAENGAEGVAAVEAADFDLIFMDIQMPVMDGVEASRRIRALPSPKNAIPIVATTANVLPKQLASYRACGINGVVAKPISPAALLTEVARVAGAAEAA